MAFPRAPSASMIVNDAGPGIPPVDGLVGQVAVQAEEDSLDRRRNDPLRLLLRQADVRGGGEVLRGPASGPPGGRGEGSADAVEGDLFRFPRPTRISRRAGRAFPV